MNTSSKGKRGSGIRDWNAYPPTLKEVKEWRRQQTAYAPQRIRVSWTCTFTGWQRPSGDIRGAGCCESVRLFRIDTMSECLRPKLFTLRRQITSQLTEPLRRRIEPRAVLKGIMA